MRYETVLFDYDGTLVRTLDIWRQAIRNAFAKRGVELTDEQVSYTYGDRRAAHKLGISDPDQCMEDVITGLRGAGTPPLYDGVKKIIKTLSSRGLRLGIVSAGNRQAIERTLRSHGLHDDFSVVLASADVGHQKPHPEGIFKALQKMEADQRDTLMVGDTEKDTGAAAAAGVDSALFYGNDHYELYAPEARSNLLQVQPTHHVVRFEELLGVV